MKKDGNHKLIVDKRVTRLKPFFKVSPSRKILFSDKYLPHSGFVFVTENFLLRGMIEGWTLDEDGRIVRDSK